MFNVGGMELLAIAILALVVLGPDRLPGALRQTGAVLGRIRQISEGFRSDVQAAISDVDPTSMVTATTATATTPVPAPVEQQHG